KASRSFLLYSGEQRENLALDRSGDPRALLLHVYVHLAADAELRQVNARLDRKARARDDAADILRLQAVHIRPVAVHFLADVVAGAMNEVLGIARLTNGLARGLIHLPPLDAATRRNRVLNEANSGVARGLHNGKYSGVLLRHRATQEANPGDVVIDAAGRLRLAPDVEQEQVALANRRRAVRFGLIVRVAAVWSDRDHGSVLHHNGMCAKLFEDPLLQIVFAQRDLIAHLPRRMSEGILRDAVDHAPGGKMRLKLRRRPTGLELLHQVGRALHFAAQATHQLHGSGVHHRNVRDSVARRILHGNCFRAAEQPRQVLAQLVLGGVDQLLPGQAIERARFDAVDELARLALRRDQIKPAARGHAIGRQA